MTLILGIDPGLDGALAFFDPDAGTLEIEDVPTLTISKGKSNKRVVDEVQLAGLFDRRAAEIKEVWLEKVGSRPGEGHAGAFSFGTTYGLLRGLTVAHFIPLYDVAPVTWKKALKVAGEKDDARLRASQIMPRHAHLWTRKKDHGRAEAALIAYYGSTKG